MRALQTRNQFTTTVKTNSIKLLIIAGARPNFMKIAPLIKAAQAHNEAALNGVPRLEWRLVHTGQHYDAKMSDIFFQELGIPEPDINLEVGSASHAIQTANIMTRFEPVCLEEKPDGIVVVGDVNSTMACTLVASKLGIKVAHVEAGLRSFDRTMPEEINRIVTDGLADLLLTPSEDADANLLREGVAPAKIKCVGNIMIDALVSNLDKARASSILKTCRVQERNFVYVTLHRPSNVDQKQSLTAIMSELAKLARQIPVVFPMHPRTKSRLKEFNVPDAGTGDLRILEPIGYYDSLCLTERARLVLTDSGGLQEESTFFKTPCLTLRPNTERPVTIKVGSNRLTTIQELSADLEEVLDGPQNIGTRPPLWDGNTAGRIIQALVDQA
jgi:UDP-N-acetylglucosamine 2-epimerase (non-hydrolysing)